MQHVLDVNRSRSEELLQLLINGEKIILIDDFFVEACKADDSALILNRNFIHLKKFPSSIFYAKTRGELVRNEILYGKPINGTDIICYENTEKIRYLIGLSESEIKRQLPSFKREAEIRIVESNTFAEQFIISSPEKVNQLDIKKYRKITEELERDIFETAITILEMLLNDKCKLPFNINDFKTQKSALFFQSYVLLWRITDWSIKKGYANSKKIINDNFDLKYVLTSCFFDELLTGEEWMKDCRMSALSFFKQGRSERGNRIAAVNPSTPPEMRFSASGG